MDPLRQAILQRVFASPSRVWLAQAHGLCSTTEEYQCAAGIYADVATLEAAHDLGMPYTDSAMYGAVGCNTLAVVQFLHAQGCTLDERMYEEAAERGRTDMCASRSHRHMRLSACCAVPLEWNCMPGRCLDGPSRHLALAA
jgi:hypothetical protein